MTNAGGSVAMPFEFVVAPSSSERLTGSAILEVMVSLKYWQT